MTPLAVLLVAAGGALGALARFQLDGAVTAARWGRAGPVPAGTLVVNAAGALLLGVLVGAAGGSGPLWLLAGGTGFCGGLTTFSTATLEAVRLAQRGRWGAAAATTGAHLGVSLVLLALGLLVGAALAPPPSP